jgi:ParB-like chromosome segregation protein Spo0J
MKALSVAAIVQVPIDSIVIGERRRKKLGRLQTLVTSIEAHGLIHPILLRGPVLVSGGRRLEACRRLMWKTIPARQVERLSDDELRAVELEENTAREALLDFEMSSARLATIRQAEADLKAKAAKAEKEFRSKPKRNSTRGRKNEGRPPTPGSKRAVAEATGISPAEQVRTERHVELAEQYPFMQRAGWGRTHVLDGGDLLDKLPADDRAPIAALLDQDALPPGRVLECLGHAAQMSPAQRAIAIQLSVSPDEHERTRALTLVGNVPPPPDPGLLALSQIEREGRRAAKVCRSPIFQPKLVALSEQITGLYQAFKDAEKEVPA